MDLKEWQDQRPGTIGIQIRTYNAIGEIIGIEYQPAQTENLEEIKRREKEITPGHKMSIDVCKLDKYFL